MPKKELSKIWGDIMSTTADQTDWAYLSAGEKKKQLFLNQKQTLDAFLSRGAISQQQYDKSLGDLREKMGIPTGTE